MSDAIPAAAAAAAAAAARCLRDLPEDVLIEILARVPDAVSLFRCAVVCRRWRRLVADPAFLRRCRIWPEGGGFSLVGFFVHPQELVADGGSGFPKLVPTGEGLVLVPAPDSAAAAFGPRRRRLTSFVRDHAGILDHARPLAARDGLLLVRLSPRPCDDEDTTVLRLCVCNLLTGRRDLLPPLDGDSLIEDAVGGYAVLTAADHGAGVHHRPADGYSTFFQVLLAGVCRKDLQVYLARFSSDSAAASQTWSWIRIPGLVSGPYGSRVAAVTRGAAHWIFIGTGPNGNSMLILDVSINTRHVAATEIPFDAIPDVMQLDWDNTWLCPSVDGRLSFFYLDKNQLRIWSRQDGDGGGTEGWHLTQAILLDTELGLSGIKSPSTVCIGEKSSTMLALNGWDPARPYVLDLRSRSSTIVAGWKRSFNYVPAVPYEMNWTEFFMSRLGVQR